MAKTAPPVRSDGRVARAKVARRGPPSASVRIGALSAIPAVLEALGHAPESVLRASGFDLAYFDDPDLPISYAAGSRLLAHCVATTGCEHFGLLLGERSGPQVLGLAGFLLMSAADVGSALRDLLRYLDLHDRGGVASLETRNGLTLLGFTVVDRAAVATDQINDLSMAIACNIMRSACGTDWTPTEVLLPRRRPDDAGPWTRVFRAPLRFSADRCAIAFPTRWLAHPVAASNPVLHRHLERQAEGQRKGSAPPLAEEVRRVVSGTLASSKATARTVASLLGMHERTLNRRLLAEGTSFKRVLDDVRYAMSQQLLAGSTTSVAAIAAALGYAESSAFIRAFARWSGATPERWRRSKFRARAPAVRRRP